MRNFNFRNFKVLMNREENVDKNIENIVIEPLDKGFGLTIGNTLRRVLLGSMPGCSVVAFKINDVNNTFMMIPGASTDTLEFISSIKELRVESDKESEFMLKFSSDEEGTYTFKDLEVPKGVVIKNKDERLIDLTGERKVDIELLVRVGRGNVESTNHENIPKDFLSIDSNFSPIKRVGYEVNPLMEDENVTHETLTMTVETNGAITAEQAIYYAAKIVKGHFEKFAEMEVLKTEFEIFEEKEKIRQSIDNTTIEELELSVRSTNALKNAGIKNVGELRALTETELRDLRNMGKRSVDEVLEILEGLDVQLGDY